MTDTGAGRRAALVGGIVAAVALAAFLLLLAIGGPLTGDTARFSTSAVLLLAALALLTAWLLVGSAFWRSDDPAWARQTRRFWEIPFVGLLSGFMLWVRLLPYQAFVGGERVYFIGTDPYYHYRETLGIVRAFPRVPRWDPWTQFPVGTATGQFGSLFDWTAALVIVLAKGRDASEHFIQQVLGVYPAVLGALVVVPLYFLAKRMLGTPAAIVASVTLSLLGGEFLERSMAGYADHHVAEALFCLVGILGVYHAAMKGHAARASLEDWRRPAQWRRPVLWSVLGGVALAANFYAWPPAILFLAILTAWLTIVILLEDGRGGDARGYALGGAVAFATTGLLMLPAIESTVIGEFNTFGILHPIASFGAAAWLVGIHALARWTRARGVSPWAVPAAVVLVVLVGYGVVVAFASQFYASLLWGLSWVTGVGVQRTTFTIGEARPAEFFCSQDGATSCLQNDFGAVAPISVLILLGLAVWTVVKRRPADILLLLWSVIIFQATITQIRFSYYLALNIALLVGWLAARISEATGLEAALAGAPRGAAPTPGAKGRKAKRVEADVKTARAWQFGAVALALVIVLPGNVLGSTSSVRAWEHAHIAPGSGGFYGRAGEVVLWSHGLEWMRDNTPDSGVDLSAIVPKPAPGQLYDYPATSYGVLTWWDYGHWIETLGRRAPVANPFQQAAPFAAKYFTERDPARAEAALDGLAQGKGEGVRYIMIDDAIATGKWGAITVWAHSQNASRDVWADGDYLVRSSFTGSAGAQTLYAVGPEYGESMMGRLYDQDAIGLGHYRLVWEEPDYVVIGNVMTGDGRLACLHDGLPTRSCAAQTDPNQLARIESGQYLALADGAKAYDTFVASRLKIFERVAGAHLVGVASPGETIVVQTRVDPQPAAGAQTRGPFDFEVTGTAGPDGRFDVVFPYSNDAPLSPAEGGTNVSARVGTIVVSGATHQTTVKVPDRAVLKGERVDVVFP